MPPVKSLHLSQKNWDLARDYHFKGFPDVKRFYSKRFRLGTQILIFLAL
jgi:hypothetical protein